MVMIGGCRFTPLHPTSNSNFQVLPRIANPWDIHVFCDHKFIEDNIALDFERCAFAN
jgi:hypothetical protein